MLSVNVVTNKNHNLKRSIPLVKPIEFEIKHKPMKKVRKRKCTYWEFKYAKWSDDGCYELRKKSTETKTVCKCYHLTDFAIAVEQELGQKRQISIIKSFLNQISRVDLRIICYIKHVHGQTRN